MKWMSTATILLGRAHVDHLKFHRRKETLTKSAKKKLQTTPATADRVSEGEKKIKVDVALLSNKQVLWCIVRTFVHSWALNFFSFSRAHTIHRAHITSTVKHKTQRSTFWLITLAVNGERRTVDDFVADERDRTERLSTLFGWIFARSHTFKTPHCVECIWHTWTITVSKSVCNVCTNVRFVQH